jgi:hypothetical protein
MTTRSAGNASSSTGPTTTLAGARDRVRRTNAGTEMGGGPISRPALQRHGTVCCEGVYLEFRLLGGSPIAVLSTAFRTGRGSQSVRPDLEDILGGTPHG